MKEFFLLFALFFAVSFSLQAQSSDAKARQALDAMSDKYQKYKSFRATFTSSMSSASEKINESFSGKITVKGNKYHLKTSGQEIYNDHKTIWTYLADMNEVTITSYDEGDGLNPTEIFNMYKKGYKYLVFEDKKVDKRTHRFIDLVPENKDLGFFKVRLEIDAKNHTLYSWKIFEKNGRVHTYKITNFEPNVAVTDTDFKFNKAKYPNVEEVDLR